MNALLFLLYLVIMTILITYSTIRVVKNKDRKGAVELAIIIILFAGITLWNIDISFPSFINKDGFLFLSENGIKIASIVAGGIILLIIFLIIRNLGVIKNEENQEI